MDNILQTLIGLVDDWGYLGVFVLMAMENSFVPLSSKLIIIPAAYLAQKGDMNLVFVIVAGISGAMLGASINYFIARYLGKPFLYGWIENKSKHSRFWNYSKKRIYKAEKFFEEHSASSLILGNLVSGFRQFIPLPAGFAEMNFYKFLGLSFIGISIWICILSSIGYFVAEGSDLWNKYYLYVASILLIIVLSFFMYLLFKKKLKKNV